MPRRFAERTLNGTVKVVVGQTLLARNAMAYEITRNALFVLAASGLAMALLAALVVRSVLRPLEKIAGGLSARDPHDLTPVDTAVPRETAVMIHALNGFMARLDRQMNSMRHLISDTAHQLRTPVAALRAQADLFFGGNGSGPQGKRSSNGSRPGPAASEGCWIRCWPRRL
ncbi:hypothetical protein QW131_18875 [Roseibium salinum]|nr:hypothetical protein [Roseibium salinum]